MTIFACGFGSGLDNLVTNLIITLITVSVSTLVLLVAAVAATRRWLKSGESE